MSKAKEVFPEVHLKYYKKACEFRGIQRAIAVAYKNQKMRCPVHLSIGQEHWLPLLGQYVEAGDRCFSSHRSHSLYLALGGKLEGLIHELYGLKSGCVQGKGGSMHLKDLDIGLESSIPIVGSSIALALGSSLSMKHSGQKGRTISYFGDGACEEGILHESLNIASTYNLPILFLCENNQYSCNTKVNRRQPSDDMKRFAAAANIEAYTINSGDSYAEMEKIFNTSIDRSKIKPIFLEIKSYRLYEHCGNKIDDNLGDRTKLEFQHFYENDPINILIKSYSFAKTIEEKFFAKTIEICNKIEGNFL